MQTTHLKAPLVHSAPISMTTISVIVAILAVVFAIGIAVSSARKAVPALSQPDAAYIAAPAPSVGDVPQAEIPTQGVKQDQDEAVNVGKFIPGNGVCSEINTRIHFYEIDKKKVPVDLKKKDSVCAEYVQDPARYYRTHPEAANGRTSEVPGLDL